MKAFLLNISSAILLACATICVFVSLTLLNDRFILQILKRHHVYETLVEELNQTGSSYHVGEVKKEMQRYVKSRYLEKWDNKEVKKYMYFLNEYSQYSFKNIAWIIYGITFGIVFLVGHFFHYFKSKQNIGLIFILCSIFLIGLYGYLYLMISFTQVLLQCLFLSTMRYLLGVIVLYLEGGIYLQIKNRISF